MPSLRRILFQDLGTKALALILALAIYVHVFSGQEREMNFRVPLQVAALPSDLALAGGYPEEARIRVRATGAELMRLSTRRFHAEVKLDEPKEGNLQRPLQGSDVKFPHGVRPVHVEILEPRVLNLLIEPTTSGRFPVAVRMSEALPRDRAMAKQPDTDPGTVEVVGPKSLVTGLDSVETIPFRYEDLPESQELKVPLWLPQGLSSEEDSVTVRLYTEKKRVRRFAPVAVELLPPQDGVIWVFPDSGSVIVAGAESVVEKVDADKVRILADLRGRGSGSTRIGLRAIVPGLPALAPSKVRCDPESVSVRRE